MTRTAIIEELIARGCEAYEDEVEFNGVVQEAVQVKVYEDSKMFTFPCTEELLNSASESRYDVGLFVDELIKRACAAEQVFNLDYVLENCYIGMRMPTSIGLTRESAYEGIEEYAYVRFDGCAGDIPANAFDDCSIAKIWERAQANTIAESRIYSPVEKLYEELLGAESYTSEDLEMLAYCSEDAEFPLYIVTNKAGDNGASSILATELLTEFAKEHGFEALVVIPASIHEMLIIPYMPGMDMAELNAVVRETNEKELAPRERLSDRAYLVGIEPSFVVK